MTPLAASMTLVVLGVLVATLVITVGMYLSSRRRRIQDRATAPNTQE